MRRGGLCGSYRLAAQFAIRCISFALRYAFEERQSTSIFGDVGTIGTGGSFFLFFSSTSNARSFFPQRALKITSSLREFARLGFLSCVCVIFRVAGKNMALLDCCNFPRVCQGAEADEDLAR